MSRIKALCVGRLLDVADCYVFDGGVRALSQRGLVALISSGRESGNLAPYLAALPSRYAHLATGPNIEFALPGGRIGHALSVELVGEICRAYVEADLAGELRKNQKHLARGAQRLMLAAFNRGLREEIDVATGYDAIRQKNELSVLFGEELRPWEETFSPHLVARLCALGFAGQRYVSWGGGSYPQPLASTFRKIYELILGVNAARELKSRNPEPQRGNNHHQWLTDEAHALLRKNMAIVAFCAQQCHSRAEFLSRLGAHYSGQASLVYAAA